MSSKINLDEPLLQQRLVRELLNLSDEEANPKVNLEDLIKLAHSIICAELLECDCDENELQVLRLEPASSTNSEERTENAFSEWKQFPDLELASRASLKPDERAFDIQKSDTPDARHTLEPLLPLPIQLLSGLSARLREATANSPNENLDIFLKFKSSPLFALSKGGCCGTVLCSDGRTHCVDTSKEKPV